MRRQERNLEARGRTADAGVLAAGLADVLGFLGLLGLFVNFAFSASKDLD